jgi:hypothetical protein
MSLALACDTRPGEDRTVRFFIKAELFLGNMDDGKFVHRILLFLRLRLRAATASLMSATVFPTLVNPLWKDISFR